MSIFLVNICPFLIFFYCIKAHIQFTVKFFVWYRCSFCFVVALFFVFLVVVVDFLDYKEKYNKLGS